MSWFRPSLSALITRSQDDNNTRLPGADSRLRRNTLDVTARARAGVAHGLYGALADNANFLPDTTDPERLLRWVSIYQLTRKPAEAASGTAALAGDNGVVIEAGTVLVRADGVRFVVDADVTIAGGVASAALTAETAGAEAATVTGQLLTFLSPIAGVGATATVEAPGIVGGLAQESLDALRARLLRRIGNPVRGGAESDYVIWATEVPGVTRAWVYANADGLGTVKVLFVCDGRDDIIPDAGDITAVSAWIEARRPVTADVTVAAPIATALNFTFTSLTPATVAVKGAIDASLRDLIAREAVPGGTLLLSHIREAISAAAGEFDYVMSLPAANPTATAGHILTFGAITWP